MPKRSRPSCGQRDCACELDEREEKIGYKIREAQLQKVPYMLVLGAKEAAEGTVAVRDRKNGDAGWRCPLRNFLPVRLRKPKKNISSRTEQARRYFSFRKFLPVSFSLLTEPSRKGCKRTCLFYSPSERPLGIRHFGCDPGRFFPSFYRSSGGLCGSHRGCQKTLTEFLNTPISCSEQSEPAFSSQSGNTSGFFRNILTIKQKQCSMV